MSRVQEEQDLFTPAKEDNPFEELNPRGSRKRKQIDFTCDKIKEGIDLQITSASPIFKKSKEMPACRSPKASSSSRSSSGQGLPMDTDQVPTSQPPASSSSVLSAPVLSSLSAKPSVVAAPALIDPGFLSKLDQKMDLLTTGMLSISAKVEEQGKKLNENTLLITAQASEIKDNSENIAEIFRRLDQMNARGPSPPQEAPQKAAICSSDYNRARRSLRLWPVPAMSETDLWGGVGDFLQDRLGLTDDLLRQEDIESINRVGDQVAAGVVRDEVLVVFVSAEKRDVVMMSANKLAGLVDPAGAPTAGIRLEVPRELLPTFRLLSRFGARLRARHGEGTKRHIKFDDFNASLYSVVKLPGDQQWTRVSPETARKDLEASFKKEEESTQQRLASKLLPDPRERLRMSQARPQRMLAPPAETPVDLAGGVQSGRRPRLRWGIPGWKAGGHV